MHLAYFLIWISLTGTIKSKWLAGERHVDEASATSDTNAAMNSGKVLVPSYITSVILNQLRENGKLSSNVKSKPHQSLGSTYQEKIPESRKLTSENELKNERHNQKMSSDYRHSENKIKESATYLLDHPKKNYDKARTYESNAKESSNKEPSSSSNYEEKHLKKHPERAENIKQSPNEERKSRTKRLSRSARDDKFYANLIDDLILQSRSEKSAASNVNPTESTNIANVGPPEEKSNEAEESETVATTPKKRFVRENLPGMFPGRLKRSDKSHVFQRQTSDKYAEHIAFRAKLGRDPSKLSSKSLMKLNKKLGIDSVSQS